MSFDVIGKYRNAIFCGDFNFTSEWAHEQRNIDPERYSDVYLDLNDGKETFSMPKTLRFAAWRPDKVLVSRASTWKPERMHRIGSFCIPSFKA